MNQYKKQIEKYRARKEALVAKNKEPKSKNGRDNRASGGNIEEWYKR